MADILPINQSVTASLVKAYQLTGKSNGTPRIFKEVNKIRALSTEKAAIDWLLDSIKRAIEDD